MPLDDDALDRLQELAALRLDPEAHESLREDLRRILDYVQQLQAVDVDDVPPTAAVHDAAAAEGHRPLRSDQAEPGLGTERALANAPVRHDDFFDLPAVMGTSSEEGERP